MVQARPWCGVVPRAGESSIEHRFADTAMAALSHVLQVYSPARFLARTLLIGIVGVWVAGCATHHVDPFPDPLTTAPEAYSVEIEPGEPVAELWWTAFDDPHLNALIEEALGQNLTVAQAAERVFRAEAILVQADAVRRPSAALTAGASRSREREHLKDQDEDLNPLDELAQARLDLKRAAQYLPDGALESGELADRWLNGPLRNILDDDGSDDWTDSYNTALSAGVLLNWELDLWGRLRALSKARRAELAAALYDYEALRLMLTSQVAETYFRAIEQRLQLALLEKQQESTQTYLELIELRLRHGAASSVDLLQQQGQLAEVNAEFPAVRADLGVLENRLDVLLGKAPDGQDLTADAAQFPALDQLIREVGVPVALLRNRPDLRALQHQVVADDYRVAAAIASRLPELTLNGSLTYEDASTTASILGMGAMDLFQPLLDWGQRKAAVTESKSVFQESLLAYTQGYLLAIEEVEAALWRGARQRELISALRDRESILEQTVAEARFRYSLGVTDYLPVLTSIQDLQQVQRDLLVQQRILISLQIELYRAIGGVTFTASEGPVDVFGEETASAHPDLYEAGSGEVREER